MLKPMKYSIIFFSQESRKVFFAKLFMFIVCAISFQLLAAQNTLPLSDLSFFQSPGPSWKLVRDVRSTFTQKDVLTTTPGTGILVNLPDPKNPGKDIIYKYQGVYGSPLVNTAKCAVKGVKVSDDGMKARIIVDNLRRNYIHTITLNGIQDQENSNSVVHPVAYYTLNNIPEGSKLSLSQVNTKNTGTKANADIINLKKGVPAKNTAEPTDQDDADVVSKKAPAKLAAATAAKQPTYEEVKNLLQKNTCLACHNPNTRQVGPAYKDVAKRKYTVAQIVELIHNPKPEHWPDYSTPMPPMTQVPNEEARKIAEWIKSLEKVK